MNESGIQVAAEPARPAINIEKPAPNPVLALLLRGLHTAASLRVTVVLFALSLILIYYGTWVQKELGIWTAVDEYFRSAIVWIPIRVLSMYLIDMNGAIPYPGGWLLGGLLLGNLLAAHAVRFKMNWKRSGIFLIHGGIVVMMLSELITGMLSVEGVVIARNGEAINYVIDLKSPELAVSYPLDSKTEDTVVIPGSVLRQGGLIQHPDLPFDVHVEKYMVNSRLVEVGKGDKLANKKGLALKAVAVEKAEMAGVETEDGIDEASAYITLKEKGTGKILGEWLVSVAWMPTQPVQIGDKTYHIALRLKRTYKPYTLHVINMRHDVYLGTGTPKNYSSLVRLVDSERGEDREVLISMNDPLRHRGETFYQSRMDISRGQTQLAVVKNPGWLMPYISCAMVAFGMLIHFGLHLIRFLGTRP